jgi:hypothetical protein
VQKTRLSGVVRSSTSTSPACLKPAALVGKGRFDDEYHDRGSNWSTTFTELRQGFREGGCYIISTSVGTIFRLSVADAVVIGLQELDLARHMHCNTNIGFYLP